MTNGFEAAHYKLLASAPPSARPTTTPSTCTSTAAKATKHLQFVQAATESGYQWSTNQEVNYVINGEPWTSLENAGVVTACALGTLGMSSLLSFDT